MAGCVLWVSVELVLGTLPHEPGQLLVPSASSMDDEHVACLGKPVGEILAHPHPLRSLTRAHQHTHHRTTALPQVNPAPNATKSRSEPGPTLPSLSA